MTGEQGTHTLFTGQRGREKEKDRGREGERELFYNFFKGMTGALAPFS
jgi:hypothetical protein